MIACPVCSAPNPPAGAACGICGAALGDASAPDLPVLRVGTLLRGGVYAVGRVLGLGGFGVTYQGSERARRRTVAIKEFFPAGATRRGLQVVPPPTLPEDDYRRARSGFFDEAATLRRFDHPGIVKIFDCFEENATAYMVMEYLVGETLAQRLERERGPLPISEALAIATQLGAALGQLHHRQLLHRDVAPDNVVLTRDSRAVLIDFGATRQFVRDAAVRATRIVKPGYAPLEQYGAHMRLGPYSDLYALAATLYHVLTGEQPPPATDRAAGAVVRPPSELNPEISERVEQALLRALEIRVDRRPQSVEEFLEALEEPRPSLLTRVRGLLDDLIAGAQDGESAEDPQRARRAGVEGALAITPSAVSPRGLVAVEVAVLQRERPLRGAQVEITLEYPEGAEHVPAIRTNPRGVARATVLARPTGARGPVPVSAEVRHGATRLVLHGAVRVLAAGTGTLTTAPATPEIGAEMIVRLVARRGADALRRARVELAIEYPEGTVGGPSLVTDATGAAQATLRVRPTRASGEVPIVARVADRAGEFLVRGAFRPLPPRGPRRSLPSGILTITPASPVVGERVRLALTTRRGFDPVRDARVQFVVALPEGPLRLPETTTGVDGSASASFVLPPTGARYPVPVTARVLEGALAYDVEATFQVARGHPRRSSAHERLYPPPPAGATRRIVASLGGGRYHRTTCEWARRIAMVNRLTFRTSADARLHGLLPCRACHPW